MAQRMSLVVFMMRGAKASLWPLAFHDGLERQLRRIDHHMAYVLAAVGIGNMDEPVTGLPFVGCGRIK